MTDCIADVRSHVRCNVSIVVLVLVVLYPFSYGPFSYATVASDTRHLETFIGIHGRVYAPCFWLAQQSDLYARYVLWWSNRGVHAALNMEVD